MVGAAARLAVSGTVEAEQLVTAGALVLVGVLAGVVLRALLGRLTRRAGDTRWMWDDLAVRLLRDLALVSATVAGVWAGVLAVGPPGPVRDGVGRVALAVLILAVSVAAARLAAGVVSTVALARDGVAQSATIFVNITRAVVFSIGILVLLQSLGVSITPLLGALGVGGLAVALALQDTLANLFAGVHILASRKVQRGDYVRLDGGEEGNIVDINWRNTTIEQLRGNLVIVPNAKFADAIVTNYARPARDMSVVVQVGVSYSSDLDEVERVTAEVGRLVMAEVDGGVPSHDPVIRFHTFGDSRIDFSVVLRARQFVDQYLVVHEFIKRLHERYRAEGIDIPFPVRTVTLPDNGGDGGADPAAPDAAAGAPRARTADA